MTDLAPWLRRDLERAYQEMKDNDLADELERQISRYRTPHPSTPTGAPTDMQLGVFRREDDRVVLAVGEIAYDFDTMTAYDLGNLLVDTSGFTPSPQP